MSKRIRIICSLLLFITIHGALVAQQPGKPGNIDPAPVKTARTAEVLATTNQILEEVSAMRGLKILNPVKSGAKSRSEIEAEIVRNFEESVTPDELDAVNKTMIAFGLV